MGDLKTLSKYKDVLVNYYDKYKNDLSKESQFKINFNPLRILDSKNPEDLKINKTVPKINEYYSKNAQKMFLR